MKIAAAILIKIYCIAVKRRQLSYSFGVIFAWKIKLGIILLLELKLQTEKMTQTQNYNAYI